MDLLQKKCVPCEGNEPPLEGAELESYLRQLHSDWEVESDRKIKKEFIFRDFKEAIGFVNRVAHLAEEEGHHPDIMIFYNKVMIQLWTHAIGGLSENDFILAAKIEDRLKQKEG